MGIDELTNDIHILFPHSISPSSIGDKSETFDHILIDLNPFLYKEFAINDDDSKLIMKVLKIIENILFRYQPLKTVFLSIDGPCMIRTIENMLKTYSIKI